MRIATFKTGQQHAPQVSAKMSPRKETWVLLCLLVPFLLEFSAGSTISPTHETIDSNKFQMRELKKSSMVVCLTPLEGGPDVEAKMRLEVVPFGAGNDKIHLAGNVDVPKDLLQQERGTSLLRYEYTTIDNMVGLNVTLNNEELRYSPFQDTYSGKFEFRSVKFYIKGRVEVAYDCPDPSHTTNTVSPTHQAIDSTVSTTPETIDSNKFQTRKLNKSSMVVCLTPLEGGPDVEAKMRLEIVPIGVGDDKIHLAGNVDVPKDLLQKEPGTSFLRYEYTTIDNMVGLNVTLNNEELSYSPFQDIYSGRFKFSSVKFYIKGRVKVAYDCSDPPHTTNTAWIYTLGKMGPIPTLVVLGFVALIVLVIAFIICCWRNNKESKSNRSGGEGQSDPPSQPLVQ